MMSSRGGEQLLEQPRRIVRSCDRMTLRPPVREDFIVVTALKGLIAKEVDGIKANRMIGFGGFGFEMLKTIGLVPAVREYIKRDLTADRISVRPRDRSIEGLSLQEQGRRNMNEDVRQTQVRKFFLQRFDHGLSNIMLLIITLVLVPFIDRSVTTNRTDIDHAISKFDEGASLDRDVQIGHVVQDELDELLILLLTDPCDEGSAGQWLAHPICDEAVLRETIVKQGRDRDRGRAELLLLLDEIGATNKANGHTAPECRE